MPWKPLEVGQSSATALGNRIHRRSIYQSIISSPLKYAVLDDYARSINADSPPHSAFLNAETHVRWKLEWRFTPAEDATEDFGPEEIDIQEDRYMVSKRTSQMSLATMN